MRAASALAYPPRVSQRGQVKLLNAAGLVTATLASAPSLLHAIAAPSLDSLAWALPLVVFVAAFLYGLRAAASRRVRRAALVVESAAALAFVAVARGGFTGGLLVVVAGEAPFVWGTAPALGVVALQTAALAGIVGASAGLTKGVIVAGGYLGFQLFAVGAATLAERETRARVALASANAELVATRDALAAATAAAERLRIARDLHDTLGHTLTALHLQLELAKNTTGDAHRRALEDADELSRALLAEVREVVGAIREELPFDLEGALVRLASAVPRPKASVHVDAAVRPLDGQVAQVILRVVQEAITNAARHADAETVVVDVTRDGEALAVTARDDGLGSPGLREGNGLRGARERLEALGGTLEIVTLPGRGTELRARIPSRGAAS